jgi:Uma2 family endonuclease
VQRVRFFFPAQQSGRVEALISNPTYFYLSAETAAFLDPTHRTTADLVIEVISPGSAIYERNTKAETYGALQVSELWLVDETGETVGVRYQTGQGFGEGRVFERGQRVVSKILPDLELPVEQLFAD